MTAHSAEDIAKEVRIYISVFAALMVLTVITVAVSYLGLSIGTAVLVALLIASIKGSLVACCFMHLISEKKIIYWVLGITILFFIALMLVPVLDVQFNAADTDV